MASMSSTHAVTLFQPQFAFSTDNGNEQFCLGKALKCNAPTVVCMSKPLVTAPCSFTTRGSAVAGRKLASRRAIARSRLAAAPFASLSLAAVTLAQPAPKQETGTVAGKQNKKSIGEVISLAGKKALSGGVPGMVAMAIQVLSLMWLRTTINYQYRYGTTTMEALKTLYAQGGIPRFYQGLLPALIQGPLSRFGDTAANTGMLALLEDVDMPVAFKTLAASLAAGAFRIVLMPVDACKTILQVEGKSGFKALVHKVQIGGPTVLFHGALAASAATFVGHYPWFATYNTLNSMLPKYDEDLPKKLLRSAFIGFCSSFVSDCCSNSIRVVKTTKQTATVPMTYGEVIKEILKKDGPSGLFLRGLGTKIITNGIQGIMFSVMWRLGQDYWNKRAAEKAAEEKAAAK
ncbi:mitochondrial substrate carrier [Volvox carteri f. nagariensis]|uniref:Mitochondrial substrate carrier n=1 Tax=Volvox carteri f. nagariensis TaxID=3068 RepID=D8UH93_VOLCA|nr:mitochondrial substrate carrier [Volvox carteri f. nagariensis]EFJ40889.1 mitochondrial substrate carrier [Volvox carteri f. nagariensis]|eukprot:XP_002958049.1 mitochondrial substrate carrier [Volvox carteri f. nagariensis]